METRRVSEDESVDALGSLTRRVAIKHYDGLGGKPGCAKANKKDDCTDQLWDLPRKLARDRILASQFHWFSGFGFWRSRCFFEFYFFGFRLLNHLAVFHVEESSGFQNLVAPRIWIVLVPLLGVKNINLPLSSNLKLVLFHDDRGALIDPDSEQIQRVELWVL